MADSTTDNQHNENLKKLLADSQARRDVNKKPEPPPQPTTLQNLKNIPAELRAIPQWQPWYWKPPAKPGKKPGKAATMEWGTPENRKAHHKTLDYVIENHPDKLLKGGADYWVDKEAGFAIIDLDKCRHWNGEAYEVEAWAQEIVDDLDSYTEISASEHGLHIVCRGEVADYKLAPDQIEIYGGQKSKMMSMTGVLYDRLAPIQECQEKLTALLASARARKYNFAAGFNPPASARPAPTHWREVFRTGDELDQAEGKIFIEGILGEGITSFGAYSGTGKTWIGLSLAHALITGEALFGHFRVLKTSAVPGAVYKPVNVLYLVPEEGERFFRQRMEKMRIPMDGTFYCQTIRDGAIALDSPLLLRAIEDMRPVVFLDTAIRFSPGEENSSSEAAQNLGAKILDLLAFGAAAVILMCHRKKGTKKESPTLENALRGSSEYAAMCDCVWCVEPADALSADNPKTRLRLTCVKPRHIQPADPFVIQGRPHIDNVGDFRVEETSTETVEKPEPKNADAGKVKLVLDYVRKNPKAGINKVETATGCRARDILESAGWEKGEAGEWHGPAESPDLGF